MPNGEEPMAIYHAKVINIEESNNEKNAPYTTPAKSGVIREMDFKTPIAPPRFKHDEAPKTAEKARQDARERARLMSDEDLGLSPEDRIRELRMKVNRRQLKSETEEDTPAKVVKRLVQRLKHFLLDKYNNMFGKSKYYRLFLMTIFYLF